MNHTTFTTQQVRSALSGDMTCFITPIKKQPWKRATEIVKSDQWKSQGDFVARLKIGENPDRYEVTNIYKAPYKVGQVIHVKETWCYAHHNNAQDGKEGMYDVIYKASDNGQDWQNNWEGWTWKPAPQMPKEAARLWLEITGVKCMRIQDACKSNPAFVKKYGSQAWDDNIFAFTNEFKIIIKN